MTEARAWMSSWSVRSVHCWRTGSGHMGATPQPKRTVASSDNQRRKFRKSGVSNVSESNQRSGESIDTVGVTGSIPVSPTTKPPDSGASSHVRIFLGPFSGHASVGCVGWRWFRCGPDVARRPRRRCRPSLPVHTTAPFRRNLTLGNPDLWQVLNGEEIVRHE
jgi:hypothetical protein